MRRTDLKRFARRKRNNPGNRLFPIQNRDLPPFANLTQIGGKMTLELGNLDFLHSHKMTYSGHVVNDNLIPPFQALLRIR